MSDLKPSRELLSFRDHARRMAAGTTRAKVTDFEAALWTQLADEIDQYIGTRNLEQGAQEMLDMLGGDA